MSEKKIWKVAVVGCGAFANGQYLPNIKGEGCECVAAVDIVPERAQAACEKYGIPNWYSSVYELIEKCDFDIAIDAASIQAHHEINMAVLGAGKHLVTQKPAAPTVEMFTEQIELAKKMGVQITCAPIHPMRYDLNMGKMMIESGVIGNPTYLKCNYCHGGPEYFQGRDSSPAWFFEEGAGALVDMGVHGLQVVTYMFGPIKAISCMAAITTPVRRARSGACNGEIIKADKIPDEYLISIEFANGKLGFIDTGFSQKATKTPTLEIYGDEGTMTFDKPYLSCPMPDVYMDCPERGIRGWINPQGWEKDAERITNQCCPVRDLIRSVENGTEPALSAMHARHILEVMCKIPEAIKSGNRVYMETTF